MKKQDLISDSVVIVGRFGAPHGLDGWVKITSFTEPASNILTYKPWLIQEQGEWRPLQLQAVEQRGSHLLAKPAGCTDQNTARHYTRLDIAITHDQLPPLPPGEYYHSDLVGLRVINQENIELGVIESVLATGANDVLVVKGEHDERLIPYLKHVVLQVDLAQGIMQVDWDVTF
jgi:16S rRNA processing protein RimM